MHAINALYETAEARRPTGAALHMVKTKDNISLRAMLAPAMTRGETRGTVLILNGRGEFLERYYETLRDLQVRGFHVAGFDWRGQGGSQRLLRDRNKGFITSFRNYDEDLRAIMDDLVTKNAPAPYYVIGHSTGGHILLRNLLHKTWFTKAIITAPLLGLQFGKWPPMLASLLSSIALAAGFGSAYIPGVKPRPFLLEEFKDNPLTSEPKRWSRDQRLLREHMELGMGGPTYAWLNATIRSLKHLHSRKFRHGLSCPTMVVLAGRERVVDNKATRRFIAGVAGVAHVTLNTSMHEIMMEKDGIRAEFFAVFDSFIGSAADDSA